MSEAPERIWVDPKPIDLGSSDGPFFTVNGSLADIPFEGHTEYIRADISAARIAALEAQIAAADRLEEFMLTARDYVDDASKGMLLYRGRSMLTDMATEDLALINAALTAYRATKEPK